MGVTAEVAQTVNGGELMLAKKGLITLRAGEKVDDVDVFATTFAQDISY